MFLFFTFVILFLIYFFEKEKRWLWRQIQDLRFKFELMEETSQRNLDSSVVVATQFQLIERPKILLLKLDHIGDIVLALPALRAIRCQWPLAEITLVSGPWGKDILEPEGVVDVFVDSLILDRKYFSKREFRSIHNKFSKDMAKNKYDLALDLRVFGDTAHLLKQVTASLKVYTRTETSMFLKDFGVFIPRSMHMAEKMMYLVNKIGCTSVYQHPCINLTEHEEIFVSEYLKTKIFSKSKLIGFHPFASVPTRDWGIKNFLKVAEILIGYGNRECLFFVGGESLAAITSLPENIREKIHVINNTTLRESAALMSACTVFVGNNSGPMHMAAAVGIPVVSVFSGVEMAWEWGPATKKSKVIYADVPCIRCHQSACSHLTCLTSIPVNLVVTAINDFIDS
jgi:ADP-heptose:LPS heptosyltransferase